jgi:hypothetical protein
MPDNLFQKTSKTKIWLILMIFSILNVVFFTSLNLSAQTNVINQNDTVILEVNYTNPTTQESLTDSQLQILIPNEYNIDFNSFREVQIDGKLAYLNSNLIQTNLNNGYKYQINYQPFSSQTYNLPGGGVSTAGNITLPLNFKGRITFLATGNPLILDKLQSTNPIKVNFLYNQNTISSETKLNFITQAVSSNSSMSTNSVNSTSSGISSSSSTNTTSNNTRSYLIPMLGNNGEQYISMIPTRGGNTRYNSENLLITVQNYQYLKEGADCKIMIRNVNKGGNFGNWIDITGTNNKYTNGKCQPATLDKNLQATQNYEIQVRVKNPSTGDYANFEFGADVDYSFSLGALSLVTIGVVQ